MEYYCTARKKPVNRDFVITELFYSHDILNMKRGSLHTKSFRRYTSLFLDTDELKIALRARKVSGAFEKRIPAELKRLSL